MVVLQLAPQPPYSEGKILLLLALSVCHNKIIEPLLMAAISYCCCP